MGQALTAEQWQAYRNAGWTDAQLQAGGYTYMAAPPVPGFNTPAPSFGGQPRGLDLSEGKFGVGEGRKPEDGLHLVEFHRVYLHDSQKNDGSPPRAVFEYKILKSNNLGNEIDGIYSTTYPTRAQPGDFGKGRDRLKGLIADIVKATTKQDAKTMDGAAWNAVVNRVVAEPSLAAGLQVVVRTEKGTTKTGYEFCGHEWRFGVPWTEGSAPAPAARLAPPPPLPPAPPAPPAPPGIPHPSGVPIGGGGIPAAPPPPPAPGAPVGWQAPYPPPGTGGG